MRSTLTRLGIAGATAALALAAAAVPAAANDDWGHGGHHHHDNPRLYKGVVTANGGLVLRSAPNRGSAVIRVAPQGEVVTIFCKTPGQPIQGNPLWYLLTDGTWAWGAARYIDNIGPAPRWC
ncbi:SH3 domain-containing protein [Streptomyces niveiscabiei]|uniref:SH3 domain-containing protein n=1 Tax=Streptomyces niveiscabiei TaxID=164115 RepID=UPI0029B96BAF|nr:SH3 domain-containing protein [Streptomyces niveiscabiei]MDX3386733.1 SH3 domain-containing protein [Streptomyces niveiscabiei]